MTVVEENNGNPVSIKTVTKQSYVKPSAVQRKYLELGLGQPGGKLPLFDAEGQEIKPATIRSCIKKGWAEPWFNNPTKPNWIVCKLTESGRNAVLK